MLILHFCNISTFNFCFVVLFSYKERIFIC
nr:MAG TPA: hypothetical protein [Caudoviricetes sp.]DAX76966.1 MAG TPA: hypothetical protein [Caudoviricetes sp.]